MSPVRQTKFANATCDCSPFPATALLLGRLRAVEQHSVKVSRGGSLVEDLSLIVVFVNHRRAYQVNTINVLCLARLLTYRRSTL